VGSFIGCLLGGPGARLFAAVYQVRWVRGILRRFVAWLPVCGGAGEAGVGGVPLLDCPKLSYGVSTCPIPRWYAQSGYATRPAVPRQQAFPLLNRHHSPTTASC